MRRSCVHTRRRLKLNGDEASILQSTKSTERPLHQLSDKRGHDLWRQAKLLAEFNALGYKFQLPLRDFYIF